MSAAAGLKSVQSDRKRNSEKENIEYRIMNIEVRYSVYFIKMTERSEPTLRHSIFDILRFAFNLV